MNQVFILFIFILIEVILLGQSSRNVDDKLIGVVVCFRHGDRAPTESYPNDPYQDSKYWPAGHGQLLDKGKVNHFKLGAWLRTRYDNFLSQRYNASEIYVRSTDVDRTLASAASTLAGLYYPKNASQSNIWHENLPWNPIPIHTIPEEDDEVLSMRKKCKNFEQLYQKTLYSEYFKDVLKRHENITKFVESKTGWNITDITTFESLYTFFYIYRMHNASYLPDWANEIDQDELSYLAGLSFSTKSFYPALRRLKVGPFFDYLNKYLDGVLNGARQKFLMLSAHDGTIVTILNSYGSYDYHPPEFCSMIVWELYETAEGSNYLKIFYRRNSTTDVLETVQVRHCSSACLFDEYKQTIKDITVDSVSWQIECNLN